MSNPKFVRLNERASRGMLADVKGSGWSISGKDVLPFPTDKSQIRFVKQNLNSGLLEPASQAEYEEVHGDDEEYVEPDGEVTHQEHKVHERAAARVEAAAARRAEQESNEESDEDDEDEDADDEEADDEGEDEPEVLPTPKKAPSKKAPAKAKGKPKK